MLAAEPLNEQPPSEPRATVRRRQCILDRIHDNVDVSKDGFGSLRKPSNGCVV
jgi:hypothetical protein